MLRPVDLSRVTLVSILANLVLISALLPYVSPVPIKTTDVQLTAGGLAVLALLFLTLVEPWKITVRAEDLTILVIGLLVLLYVDFRTVPMDTVWLRDCGTVLLCFPIYFAIRNLYRYTSPWALVAVVSVYLTAILVEAADPSLYLSTFAKLMSDVRLGGSGGLNGLTPEPSYMGDLSVLFCISIYFFHREFWKRHKVAKWYIVISSVAMAVISRSATGVAVGLAVAIPAWFTSSMSTRIKIILPIIMGLLAGGAWRLLSGSPEQFFISSLLQRPLNAVNDESFIERFSLAAVATLGIPYQPFGTRQLNFEPLLVEKALNSSAITVVWPDPQTRNFVASYVTHRNVAEGGSGVGYTIQRMGFLSFLAILVLLSFVSGFRGHWIVRLFLLAYILNASPSASTFWFVIGCCAAPRRSNAGEPLKWSPTAPLLRE